jgi:hypothetical protein
MLYYNLVAHVIVPIDASEGTEEQLIEVYEALLVTDKLHLHHALNDLINLLSPHTQGVLHVGHESDQPSVLNLQTVVVSREMCPC